MRRWLPIALSVVCLVVARPAYAQSGGAGSQNPGRIGLRTYAMCDSLQMAASKSFDAVFGTSTLSGCGAGVEVVDLWKHIFVRVTASRVKKTGERVFVSDGTAYPLGIPLEMSMTPTELGAGWRFVSDRRPSRFVPYVGAGAVWLNYEETSDFADSGENVSTQYTGSTVFGGVDVALVRYVSVGGEVGYRTVNANGLGGASQEFSEKNLGGAVLRFTVGFRF